MASPRRPVGTATNPDVPSQLSEHSQASGGDRLSTTELPLRPRKRPWEARRHRIEDPNSVHSLMRMMKGQAKTKPSNKCAEGALEISTASHRSLGATESADTETFSKLDDVAQKQGDAEKTENVAIDPEAVKSKSASTSERIDEEHSVAERTNATKSEIASTPATLKQERNEAKITNAAAPSPAVCDSDSPRTQTGTDTSSEQAIYSKSNRLEPEAGATGRTHQNVNEYKSKTQEGQHHDQQQVGECEPKSSWAASDSENPKISKTASQPKKRTESEVIIIDDGDDDDSKKSKTVSKAKPEQAKPTPETKTPLIVLVSMPANNKFCYSLDFRRALDLEINDTHLSQRLQDLFQVCNSKSVTIVPAKPEPEGTPEDAAALKLAKDKIKGKFSLNEGAGLVLALATRSAEWYETVMAHLQPTIQDAVKQRDEADNRVKALGDALRNVKAQQRAAHEAGRQPALHMQVQAAELEEEMKQARALSVTKITSSTSLPFLVEYLKSAPKPWLKNEKKKRPASGSAGGEPKKRARTQ